MSRGDSFIFEMLDVRHPDRRVQGELKNSGDRTGMEAEILEPA